jgi:hypothetical protein
MSIHHDDVHMFSGCCFGKNLEKGKWKRGALFAFSFSTSTFCCCWTHPIGIMHHFFMSHT